MAVGTSEVRKVAKTVWLLADSCRAAPGLRPTAEDLKRGVDAGGNLIVCTASSGDTPRYESDRLKHGLFAQAWLEALRGAPSSRPAELEGQPEERPRMPVKDTSGELGPPSTGPARGRPGTGRRIDMARHPHESPQPAERTWDRRTCLCASAALIAAPGTARAEPAGEAGEGQAEEGQAQPPGKDPLLASENGRIRVAREVALDVLKPSPAELQLGLEVHRRALVLDAYGFAPRAALDVPTVTAAIEAGASDVEVQDLQEEQSMTGAAAKPAELEEFREAFRCSGVTCIFQNAGEEGQDPNQLMKRLARFTFLTDMLRGTLVRASLPGDIEAAHRSRQHCLYLTGNGVPLAQQWLSVEAELGYVRLFFQLGIRMMHVTYNRRNMLGDGCAETANGGLSDFGRAAVAEMNRVGVIVDVAHSGQQTSLDAARTSRAPMVASHTTCAALHPHIRAKDDAVIRAICDTGGLVGICCIPGFLGRGGDIAALLDHVDHVARKFGIDRVAIGTDVAHTSQHAGAAARAFPHRRSRERFAALWPPGSRPGNSPRSTSLAWTNWPLFTVGLVQRGYTEEQIRKILGGNMLRVCRDVLAAAR